jgi:hypothetical protein
MLAENRDRDRFAAVQPSAIPTEPSRLLSKLVWYIEDLSRWNELQQRRR